MHRILLWVLSLSQSNTQYNPLLSMHFTLGLHVKMHMKISCMCYKFVSLFSTVQELANRSYIYVKESSEESALLLWRFQGISAKRKAGRFGEAKQKMNVLILLVSMRIKRALHTPILYYS